MNERLCTQCGSTFYAEESWKKLCIRCWKTRKGVVTSTRPDRYLQGHEEGYAKGYKEGYKEGYAKGYRKGYEKGKETVSEASDGSAVTIKLSKAEFKMLQHICHPDTHNTSKMKAKAEQLFKLLLGG